MEHSVALLQIDPPEEASAWPKAQKASGSKASVWKGRGRGRDSLPEWELNGHKELAKTE